MINQLSKRKIAAIGGLSINALILLTFVAAVVYSYSVGPSNRMNQFPAIKMPTPKPVAAPEVPVTPPVVTTKTMTKKEKCNTCILVRCFDEINACTEIESCGNIIHCVPKCKDDNFQECFAGCASGASNSALNKYRSVLVCEMSCNKWCK